MENGKIWSRKQILAIASALLLATALSPVNGAAADTLPALQAMPGTPVLPLGSFDIGALGYSVDEFSVTGTATAYKIVGEQTADGHWKVAPDGTAPYKTRIVVIKPKDPAKFNGTVVVEWINVSGGLDVPVDWTTTHRELLRRGYAYVAVSAQKVGIEGGGFAIMAGLPALKQADPARYGTLHHPGDAYSYDIFAQIGHLLRTPAAKQMLGPMKPQRLIAMGESQSAGRLATYVDAIEPVAHAYDGIIVHSRGAGGAPMGDLVMSMPKPGPDGKMPPFPKSMMQTAKLRTDGREKLMEIITETDLLALGGGFLDARQPDNANYRLWEIPGAAHMDNYLFSVGGIDSGSASTDALAKAWAPTRNFNGMLLQKFGDNGPQQHYVTEAALWQMDQWLRTKKAPPSAPRLDVDLATRTLRTDSNGNAMGGVFVPWIAAPVSKMSGLGNGGGFQALLIGTAEPFDQATLDKLYPGGKAEYLNKFTGALDESIKAGYILPEDKTEILALAEAQYPGSK